ncbi:MAG: SLOG family protein [Defluviicoccus sp.]|nr:SLOG family protein [Defluviicoccus sp.]MDE0277032.1 SLOG family protein [Defluviicoccus sp.]
MSDRSPRLSDDDTFNSAMADAFADAGLSPEARLIDPQYEIDGDPEARFLRENGVSEELLESREGAGAEDIRERGREEIETAYGTAQQSSTARLSEDAALHGARPLAGEPDTRQVWLNGDRPLTFDGPVPPDLQAAFDQIGAAIEMQVEVVTPHGYQMEDEREDFIWSIVHGYHAQVVRVEKRIAEVSEQANTLRKTEGERIREKGLDTASLELEAKTEQLLSLASKRDRFEQFRDYAADLYFHHTKLVWAPWRGSHVSQTGQVAARVDGKDFARARKTALDTREIPDGTLVAITGGKGWNDRDAIYRKLDEYLGRYPDMVLAHGGGKDLGRIASTWVRNRGDAGVSEIVFQPEWNRHENTGTAIRERDDRMLNAQPGVVIHFETPGERASRLYERARTDRLGIETENVVDETLRRQAAARRRGDEKQAGAVRADTADRAPRADRATVPTPARAPVYAGVGARATPGPALDAMTTMSDWLAGRGWHLHSGGANGADTAFARGADAPAKTVFLPWQGFNNQEGPEFVVPSPETMERAKEIAASLHPDWDKCQDSHKLLHARNVAIVLGPNLDTPVDALACWTENGKTAGGTGMAIRVAEKFDIPVFNLATEDPRTVCEAMIEIEKTAPLQQDNSQSAGIGRKEEQRANPETGVETTVRQSPAETVTAPEVAAPSRTLATRAESRHANPTYPPGMIEARQAEAILHGPPEHRPQPDIAPRPEQAPEPDAPSPSIVGRLVETVRTILPGGDQARAIEPAQSHAVSETRYPGPAAEAVPQLAEPAATWSPEREPPDISEAFTAMVDAAVPDTEENEAVRKTLFHRVVDAVHSTVSGPGGVEDQADRLHDRRADLAREDYGSEIGVFQTLENEQKLETALTAQDMLQNARATLAAVAEEQTGERWTPAPSPGSGHERTVTAASAEASEVIDRLKIDRDRARLPQQGTPIAISAWNDNTDRQTVHDVLDQTLRAKPDMYIAHGNGHGTPEIVAEWARNNGVYQATFEPDRHRHGKQAAAERDRRLFQTVQPQIVIDFQGPKPTALAQEARENKVTIWPVDEAKKEELRRAREARAQTPLRNESMQETLSSGKSAGMSM